jgi:hypothetical protein
MFDPLLKYSWLVTRWRLNSNCALVISWEHGITLFESVLAIFVFDFLLFASQFFS